MNPLNFKGMEVVVEWGLGDCIFLTFCVVCVVVILASISHNNKEGN